jgi:hypothetical protein
MLDSGIATDTMLDRNRHDCGYPRFVLDVTTSSSDQTHRLYVAVQGKVDSHDARGSTWEVVQYRPLNAKGALDAIGRCSTCHGTGHWYVSGKTGPQPCPSCAAGPSLAGVARLIE